MKELILIILSVLMFTFVHAQSDSSDTELVQIPNSEYVVYKYDSTLQTLILTYQYVDICDLDNDGIKDSISFIGNGGAHLYFYLQIKLSSNHERLVFRTFQIDMPYPIEKNTINEITQFSILDYDKDGIDEVYLNIDNPFGSIPAEIKTNGLTSKQMIIEFENGELVIKNYIKN